LRSSVRRALSAASAAALLTCTSACASARFVPPVGPGDPAPDAAAAWVEATRACRGVASYKASLRVSGRIGGERLPTTINIATGATPTGIRLEGRAANRNIFQLAGTADEATLYLDDGHRSATGRPEDLTEALMGVKLGPGRWLALLTGCVASPPDFISGARYGADLAVTTPGGRVFLALENRAWRSVHGTFDGLVVTYGRFSSTLPGEWSLKSEPGRDPAMDLSVSVDDMTAGDPIASSVFALALPDHVTAMTLDELRQSGPLRRKGR
jgi:hypothetical protein